MEKCFLHNDEKLHSWKLQNFRENKFAVKRKSFPRLSVNLVVGVEKLSEKVEKEFKVVGKGSKQFQDESNQFQSLENWWSRQNKLMKVIRRLFSSLSSIVAKGLSTSSFFRCLKPFEIAFHVCRLLHFLVFVFISKKSPLILVWMETGCWRVAQTIDLKLDYLLN